VNRMGLRLGTRSRLVTRKFILKEKLGNKLACIFGVLGQYELKSAFHHIVLLNPSRSNSVDEDLGGYTLTFPS
jgi:hypothetical protein